MGLAIMVAAAGFTVLIASSAANRLQTVGTVEAHAKGLYDILVGPPKSANAVEASQGLAQPGFLSGVCGGITLDQWKQIKATSGMTVAAPIAMVGSVVLPLGVPVRTDAALPASGDGVARVDVTYLYDNGLSKVLSRRDSSPRCGMAAQSGRCHERESLLDARVFHKVQVLKNS